MTTGECGREKWDQVEGDDIAKANIDLLNDAGIPYTISTGGAKGVFTCSSTSGADAFLKRYNGPLLQGLDIDIEIDYESRPEQLSNLIDNILYLQRKNPKLIISFTLASLASTGSDASSINELGESILKAADAVGLKYVVNFDGDELWRTF